MFDKLMQLVAAGLPGIVQSVAPTRTHEPCQFTVRIPADHPKADRLVKLFKFLETRVVMPSGIEIKRSAPVRDPATEFLDMLRDVVDDKESFDQALNQVTSETRQDGLETMGLILQQPKALAAMLEAPLAQGFMGDRVEHQDHKKWALKAARKLRDRS